MVTKVGERILIVVGLALQALGFLWIAIIAGPDLNYTSMILPLAIAGGWVSLAMPASQNAVIGAVPRPAIGKASGTFNMLRQLGGTFGIAILAAVFASRGGFGSPQHFSDGFAPAMRVAALLSILGAVVGLAAPGKQQAAAPPAAPAPERAPAVSAERAD